MSLTNLILPSSPSTNSKTSTYDIEISNNIIRSISPHTHVSASSPSAPCPPPSILLPTLCHPHIHLDKPYLLTSNYNHPASYPPCCPLPPPPPTTTIPDPQPSNNDDHSQSEKHPQHSLPDYGALAPKAGSFPEALALTSKAKQLYTSQDLYLRGKQLLAASYTQGITSARCFVEVDHVTKRGAVEVGVKLKEEFEGKGLVRVQLCAFAQDPLFGGPWGEENRGWLEEVLERFCTAGGAHCGGAEEGGGETAAIEVLGTTPYVEQSREAAVKNVEWAVGTALKYGLHLDFHLDYNLDESKTPGELMVWEVLRVLVESKWPKGRTVVLGHCAALTLLPHEGAYSLTSLARKIKDSGLPVYFVGLPTSDLYMMGRPPERGGEQEQSEDRPLHRPRGTLNILSLAKDYGLKGCVGVNNVGNAFTPFGSGDPLELAGWCVGIYQGGGEGDAERLFGMVSRKAREAIGLEEGDGGEDSGSGRVGEVREDGEGSGGGGGHEWGKVNEGTNIGEFGLMVVRNEEYIGGKELEDVGMRVPARRRVGVRDVVWDVPEARLRTIVR